MTDIHPRTSEFKPSVVAAQIEPHEDGTFGWSKTGRWALTVGVYDRDERLVDFVAYFLDDPSTWFLRRANQTPVLGTRDLAFAADNQQPVNLYSTPNLWLFGHRRRSWRSIVCIVDWGADIAPLLDGVSRVECDTPELQKRLRHALRKWEPKITASRQNLLPAEDFRTARRVA